MSLMLVCVLVKQTPATEGSVERFNYGDTVAYLLFWR